MSRKQLEFEFEYDDAEYDEPNGMFDSLFLGDFERCFECDYDGPLVLRKRGYVCPSCKTLILEC